jgi:hypothetical protein
MRNSSFSILGTLGVLVLAVGLVWGFGAITHNPEGAVSAATSMGFTQVEVQKSGIFFPGFRGCSDKDYSYYKITALNSQGQPVDLLVCKGLFKGYTVRVK